MLASARMARSTNPLIAAYHAGEAATVSIGIELSGLGAQGPGYRVDAYRALGSLGRLLVAVFPEVP